MQKFETLDEGCFYHVYNHAVGGLNLFHNERDYRHFLYLYEKYIHPIAETYAWVLMPNHFHLLVRIRKDVFYRYLADGVVEKVEGKYMQPYVDLFSSLSSSTSDSSCEAVRRVRRVRRLVETDRWKEMKWETMYMPNLSSSKAIDSVGYNKLTDSLSNSEATDNASDNKAIDSDSNDEEEDKEELVYRQPKPEKHFSHLCSSYSLYYNRKHDKWGTLFQRPFKRKRIDNEDYLRTVLLYIHNNPIHHGFCNHPLEYPWTSYLSCASDGITKLKRKEVMAWFGGREGFLAQHKGNDDNDRGDLEVWLEM